MGRSFVAVGAIVFAITSGMLGAACTLLSGADDLGVGDQGASGGASSSGTAGSSGANGDGGFLPDGAPIGTSSGTTSSSGQIVPGTSGTPVFFLRNVKATNMAVAGMIVGTSSPRSIGCERASGQLFNRARTVTPTSGGPATRNGPYRSASLAMRAHEDTNTPGSRPSALAYPDVSGVAPTLLLATEKSECQNQPPVRIDFQEAPSKNVSILMPRFSPDGSRVAYLEETGNDIVQVVSVSADGGGGRGIRKTPASGGGNAGLWFTPPAWISTSEVVWVERQGAAQNPLPLIIQRGPDVATSTPTTTVSCNTYVEQLEVFRRDGAAYYAVVASKGAWSNNQAGPSQVGTMSIEGPCTLQPITPDNTAGFAARDVRPSPNGQLLAFASNADTAPQMRKLDSPAHIYIADSLGKSPPVLCSGGGPDTDDFGPQWVDGGKKLVWTHSTRPTDQESIWMADIADGKCVGPRMLIGDNDNRYLLGANAGVVCSITHGGSTGGGALFDRSALAMLGLLALARRRRRPG